MLILAFRFAATRPAIAPARGPACWPRLLSMAPKLNLKRVRKRAMKAKRAPTSQRHLDAFARGVIWGMHVAGLPRADMPTHIQKPDGSAVPVHVIDKVIAKKKASPEWRGAEAPRGGGRPRAVSAATQAALCKLVFEERGSHKVTISYCKKRLPALRKVSNDAVERYLHAAGLKWLTRRRKSWAPAEHKTHRLSFAGRVLRMHASSLSRWAYTDGTTFFLARGADEGGQKRRAALGPYVWRQATGSDGLYDDNVGPSLYAKAQGLPVKIWGFLANGHLDYWVLPADPEKPSKKTAHMNGETYHRLVTSKFADWRRSCFGDDEPCRLVQDHEKCLWVEKNLRALRQAGCEAMGDYPKSSPDLNAIEEAWNMMRQRLESTEPVDFEDRPAFLARLRRCVNWLNEHQGDALLTSCTNQKDRAKDVIKLKGAKTKW